MVGVSPQARGLLRTTLPRCPGITGLWRQTNEGLREMAFCLRMKCIWRGFPAFSYQCWFRLIFILLTWYDSWVYGKWSIQSLSRVRLFATPWTAACQASLSIINSRSLHKLMSIELVMPSNHLILCCPLLLLPSIFPNIKVFSNESVLCIRWPKYWSFSFSISPSNEHPGLISLRMDWLDLLAVQGLSRVFSKTTVQKHQFFGAQLSLQSNSDIHTWLLEKP